jgi:translation machinery-associated protein 16
MQFIKDNLPEVLSPLPLETILAFVEEYVTRNRDELADLQAGRKHGKLPGARELNMRQQQVNEMKEFETGYWIPDLTDVKNMERLSEWNGQWVGLNCIKFVRVTKSGEMSPSTFPPGGKS